MRDLRFRVWHPVWMRYVQERDFDDGCGLTLDGRFGYASQSSFGPTERVDQCVVEESTGLCDQKGALIYENDILRGSLPVMGGPDIEWRGSVMWDDERARFVAVDKAGDMRELPLLGGSEVCGNVHESTL